jgi:hypothetical protein
MRPSGSPKELERRRFRAMTLLSQGHQPVEVARMDALRGRNAAERRQTP